MQNIFAFSTYVIIRLHNKNTKIAIKYINIYTPLLQDMIQ